MSARDGWSAFRGDLRAALRAWRHDWLIPVVTVTLALATLVGVDRWWIALPVLVASAGWVGTERMFYLRTFRGLPLLPMERWRFTWAFFGRFAVLGAVMSIPFLALLYVITAARAPDALFAGAVLLSIALDVALTFVTPALAFSTRRVTLAWRIGHRTLVDLWPASAWYAVFPPMAALIAARVLPRTVIGTVGVAGLTAIGALLNLWFKGAVVAFYLRHHDVGDDGAVNASHTQYLDQRMRQRFHLDDER